MLLKYFYADSCQITRLFHCSLKLAEFCRRHVKNDRIWCYLKHSLGHSVCADHFYGWWWSFGKSTPYWRSSFEDPVLSNLCTVVLFMLEKSHLLSFKNLIENCKVCKSLLNSNPSDLAMYVIAPHRNGSTFGKDTLEGYICWKSKLKPSTGDGAKMFYWVSSFKWIALWLKDMGN